MPVVFIFAALVVYALIYVAVILPDLSTKQAILLLLPIPLIICYLITSNIIGCRIPPSEVEVKVYQAGNSQIINYDGKLININEKLGCVVPENSVVVVKQYDSYPLGINWMWEDEYYIKGVE